MNTKILKLLSDNARYTTHELSVMTGIDEEAVKVLFGV